MLSSDCQAIRTKYKFPFFRSVPRSSPSKALRTCYRINTSQSVVPIGFSFYPTGLPPKCRFSHTKIRTWKRFIASKSVYATSAAETIRTGKRKIVFRSVLLSTKQKTSEETQNSGKQQALVEVNIAGLPKTSGHPPLIPSLLWPYRSWPTTSQSVIGLLSCSMRQLMLRCR